MLSIGWRNLKKDRLRMGITVFGVIFAVVLVTVEVGMLLALARNASLLIDRSHADIWVSTVDVKTFDFATPLEQRKRYLIEAIPGVECVEEFNCSYSMWKLPSGGSTNVQIVGFDRYSKLAPELELSEGEAQSLHNRDTIIIDEGERAKLDYPKVGDTVEIIGHRARIVGISRGMRSFTTTPFVFTSLRRASHYSFVSDAAGREVSIYFLVKVKPGYDVEQVREAISGSVSNIEAHTKEGFSWRTRKYWLIETGVGLGFLAAAMLGLLVGGVIVSQTLYAMTKEKLPEFGVLKALGANMKELSRIVLEQGLICGSLGLLLGIFISYILGAVANAVGAAVEMPWWLLVGVMLMTASLCTGSALLSVVRLRNVEPAMVFRT